MRNFIIVALLLASMNTRAQKFATIYIWDIRPDTAYLGDSIDIDFKFVPPNQTPEVPYATMQLADANLKLYMLWNDDWRKLYNFPKYPVGVGNDSVYRMRVKIPVEAKAGACRIYAHGGDNMSFTVLDRVATSVKNHVGEKPVSHRYFDLWGRELEEAPAGAMFIRMDVYAGGDFTSRLVIAQ